ncbi:MAG: hypothetical protein J6T74_02390 [Clostridia bacterium]|nr:hypothetical protein [Clostridia bacterium]
MREDRKYHIRDYLNIVVFYCVFISFFVASIMGIVGVANGSIEPKKLVFRLLLTFIVCLPYLLKKIFRFKISTLATSLIYFYIFLAGFLGVVLEFYSKLEWWDIIIHFLMGLLLAVFSIYILNATVYKKDTSKHNMVFTCLFMIMFALSVGAIWEMGEYLIDGIFDSGFQRYVTYGGLYYVGRLALTDTMVDLIMDFAGAIAGTSTVMLIWTYYSQFLKTFKIKKLKKSEQEIECIEE